MTIFIIVGNDNLHYLLSQGNYELRYDMADFENETRYVKYSSFSVGDEASKYTVSVSGYSGDVGNVFKRCGVFLRSTFLYHTQWVAEGIIFLTCQSVSPSVLYFLSAQLLWNRSTKFREICSYDGHNVQICISTGIFFSWE